MYFNIRWINSNRAVNITIVVIAILETITNVGHLDP